MESIEELAGYRKISNTYFTKVSIKGMKVKDFMLAKAEYENMYSIEELMEMKDYRNKESAILALIKPAGSRFYFRF